MHSNVVRWSIWWLLLGGLTVALVTPQPAQIGAAILSPRASFAVSKAIHLGAYAFFTVLVAWLPTSRRSHVLLWGLLAVHGCFTEYLQTFVPGRFGTLRDVAINQTGLILGLLLVWWWQRRRPA